MQPFERLYTEGVNLFLHLTFEVEDFINTT